MKDRLSITMSREDHNKALKLTERLGCSKPEVLAIGVRLLAAIEGCGPATVEVGNSTVDISVE